MENVNEYLFTILKPQLEAYGVSTAFTDKVLQNIKMQIVSMLRHWNDLYFRKALLVVGIDQAQFYEPEADIDIKCFVVTAIRNSMIETIQSNDYQKAGLKESLGTEHVKAITGAAVSYFSKIDIVELSKYMDGVDIEDYYSDICDRYPVAWTALRQLGMCKGKSARYKKMDDLCPMSLPEMEPEKKLMGHFNKVVADGYSDILDNTLLSILRGIDSGEIKLIIVDSFKAISRNYEKLLKVMEYTLTNEAAFVTSNFYLENGYVERRKRLLRAAHTVAEHKSNFAHLSGAGPKLMETLKENAAGFTE